SPSSGTPEEAKKAADELADIGTRMGSTYSSYKATVDGKPLNLEQLTVLMGSNRDPKKLDEAWESWRKVSPGMAKDYARQVEIANRGAQERGFKDVADLWLSNYDMPSADMEKTVERLWTQVEPLYKELHCYVRTRLNEKYGDAVQPKTGPIRA